MAAIGAPFFLYLLFRRKSVLWIRIAKAKLAAKQAALSDEELALKEEKAKAKAAKEEEEWLKEQAEGEVLFEKMQALLTEYEARQARSESK